MNMSASDDLRAH